jgi:hypothetical protein
MELLVVKKKRGLGGKPCERVLFGCVWLVSSWTS